METRPVRLKRQKNEPRVNISNSNLSSVASTGWIEGCRLCGSSSAT
jgi:hypothetical protein